MRESRSLIRYSQRSFDSPYTALQQQDLEHQHVIKGGGGPLFGFGR
jgi:hypothetical protein